MEAAAPTVFMAWQLALSPNYTYMNVCTYMYPQWKQLHLLCSWPGNWPTILIVVNLQNRCEARPLVPSSNQISSHFNAQNEF